MIWKRTRFFAPNETPVALRYCWSAQCSWSYPFLFQPLDVVCSVALLHTLPKSRCKQWRIGDRPQARIPTVCGLPLHHERPCKRRQSHGCLHQELTRPTACFLCCPQMTTVHHIEWLASPFFRRNLHFAPHVCILFIHVLLESSFRNLCCTNNSRQWYPL